MRIIDADQAKEIAEVSLGDIFLQTALKLLIDKVPTIDAVPVVRCKDCKWYGIDSEKGGFCALNTSPSMWTDGIVQLEANDFCFRGGRKRQ